MKKDILILVIYILLILCGSYGFMYLYSFSFLSALGYGRAGEVREAQDIIFGTLFIFTPLLYFIFPAILTLIALESKWSKYINWFYDNLLYPTILLIIIFIPDILSFCTKKDNDSIIAIFSLPYAIIYAAVCCKHILEKSD